jgi:hypothetical protein
MPLPGADAKAIGRHAPSGRPEPGNLHIPKKPAARLQASVSLPSVLVRLRSAAACIRFRLRFSLIQVHPSRWPWDSKPRHSSHAVFVSLAQEAARWLSLLNALEIIFIIREFENTPGRVGISPRQQVRPSQHGTQGAGRGLHTARWRASHAIGASGTSHRKGTACSEGRRELKSVTKIRRKADLERTMGRSQGAPRSGQEGQQERWQYFEELRGMRSSVVVLVLTYLAHLHFRGLAGLHHARTLCIYCDWIRHCNAINVCCIWQARWSLHGLLHPGFGDHGGDIHASSRAEYVSDKPNWLQTLTL